MKVPSLSKWFARVASSKTGEKIYKNILDPKKDDFWNITAPIIETSVASTAYIANCAVSDIPRKEKKALQYQNVLSWVASIAISIPLNRKLNKTAKAIEKQLKPEIIPDFHKVKQGLGIGLPLVATIILNRALIPAILVPISSVLRDKDDERLKKLDLKA